MLRHDGKLYCVSPFALTWDDENYYLIAYDTENSQIRHYRVDKMVRIRVRDERRDGAERFRDFDMAQYSKKTFGMFRGQEELVTLRCHNRLAGIVIDRFGRETTFHKADATHFEVRVRVAISPLFLTWVLNFGAEMEIVSPDSVRAELVQLLRSTLAQYEK